MSLTGTLETFNLSSLLQLLSNDQKTGVLRVTDSLNEVNIYLKDGIIVYASSSQERLRLGRVLVNSGEISEQTLRSCLRLAKDSGQKLGKTLLKAGHISIETLKKALYQQVKEVLFDLFLWKAGKFEFKAAPIKIEGKLVTKMNTMEILLDASRRIDEWSIIWEQINSELQIFSISEKTQDKKEIKLTKTEWRVLSLVDGERTAREIVDQSGHDEFAAFKSLCALMLSGLIEKCEEGANRFASPDYEKIANIYLSIFKVLQKDMQSQLGDSFLTMFEQCKASLLPEQKDLFKDFKIGGKPKDNIQAIVKGMGAFKDPETGRTFLSHSLNTLLELILEKEVETLGYHLTGKTLEEIRHTLSYVKEYNQNSEEGNRIFGKVQNILDAFVPKREPKKSASRGVLSIFKGKKSGSDP